MSLDLLTKLNPKSVTLVPSGGKGKYDLDDVIDAIKHLSPLATLYIYAVNECLSNDNRIEKNKTQLQIHFGNILHQQIVEDEFETRKISQQALAYGIARASIHAHFYARGQCKTCNGVGIVFKNGSKRCKDCFGKGISQINDVQKCRIAFPTINFERSWWRKYARSYEYIVQDELNKLLMDVDQEFYAIQKKQCFNNE